jgi:hypothetical protein
MLQPQPGAAALHESFRQEKVPFPEQLFWSNDASYWEVISENLR